eukprot:TRINITY_DN2960_c0_g1_i2.p1 TRINITY_DN2960_c0_g1~~TRINITY_DN2960_c0_g1_i2.p1  ORF type:complete len:599 (+),score=109.31 TRINITY_DN2960_c0_g1_i2:302-2098(+)
MSLFQFRSRRGAWVFGISLFLLAAWLGMNFYKVNQLPTPHLPGKGLFTTSRSAADDKLAAMVRVDLERQSKLIAKKEQALNELLKDVSAKGDPSLAKGLTVVWDEPNQQYKLVAESQTQEQPKSSEYTLLIVVFSSIEHYENRKVLRDRWKSVLSKPSNKGVSNELKIVFLLGDPRLGPDAGRLRGKALDDDEEEEYRQKTWADDEEPPQGAEVDEVANPEVQTYPGFIKQHCEKLKSEQELYNDLLFVRDVPDSYYTLGERIKAAVTLLSGEKNSIYEWDNSVVSGEGTTNNRDDEDEDVEKLNFPIKSVDRSSLLGFSYMMKVDDDSYVKLDRVLDMVANLPKTAVYWGQFLKNAKVILSSANAWYNPEYADLSQTYPAYAAGGAYILSRDLVEMIGRSPVPFKVWKGGPEDAQLGTWLSGVDVERVEAAGAIWTKRCATCECNSTALVAVHGFAPVHLQQCFTAEDEHDLCNCVYIQSRIQEVSQNARARSTSRGTVIRPSSQRYDTKRNDGTPIWLLVVVSFVSFLGCGILGGFCIFLFCRLRNEVKKLKKLERGEDTSDEDSQASDEDGFGYYNNYKDSGEEDYGYDDDDDDD